MIMPVRTEGFVESEGVRLHYIDWDGTGMPLLLLAGLGDNAQIFTGLAPKLSGSFRLIALTRRGHGRSDRPDAGYDLDTLIGDVQCFLKTLGIDQTILVGHSFGGIEAACFAAVHPSCAAAIVYLDALFPKLDPEPDLSGDPIWSVLPTGAPTAKDLHSRESYLRYYRRRRPDWARIWHPAIEADLMDRVTISNDGHILFRHDDNLMNQILKTILPPYPDYALINVPQLAVVPAGRFHASVPLDATVELRQEADQFWQEKILPWVQQRTAVFRRTAPDAKVVELDSPYHHIFIAEEKETSRAIIDLLSIITFK
jgi:pimeloyl-ACP methyl ester carboxylesterase